MKVYPELFPENGCRGILRTVDKTFAKYVDDYRIWLKLNTGDQGEVDFSEILQQYPIASQLLNKLSFKKFIWMNGLL